MHHKWEEWAILHNVINYVQNNRTPKHYYKLNFKALKPKNIKECMIS